MFYLAAGGAVILAGISKGGFGGGLGFAATPILALAMGPADAAAVMLPILILMDQIGLASYWRRWSVAQTRPLIAAAIPGIAAGAALFSYLSADAIRLGLGLIALAFAAFQTAKALGWRPPGSGPAGRASALLWGGIAGFTSFVSHAGGPPVTMHLIRARLEKTVYQASTVLIFWWINLIKLGPYFAIGLFSPDNLSLSLGLAPVAAVGVILGVWLHRRVGQTWFFRAVLSFLFATGAKLVWDGGTKLL